jgi:hypothetical protein
MDRIQNIFNELIKAKEVAKLEINNWLSESRNPSLKPEISLKEPSQIIDETIRIDLRNTEQIEKIIQNLKDLQQDGFVNSLKDEVYDKQIILTSYPTKEERTHHEDAGSHPDQEIYDRAYDNIRYFVYWWFYILNELEDYINEVYPNKYDLVGYDTKLDKEQISQLYKILIEKEFIEGREVDFLAVCTPDPIDMNAFQPIIWKYTGTINFNSLFVFMTYLLKREQLSSGVLKKSHLERIPIFFYNKENKPFKYYKQNKQSQEYLNAMSDIPRIFQKVRFRLT